MAGLSSSPRELKVGKHQTRLSCAIYPARLRSIEPHTRRGDVLVFRSAKRNDRIPHSERIGPENPQTAGDRSRLKRYHSRGVHPIKQTRCNTGNSRTFTHIKVHWSPERASRAFWSDMVFLEPSCLGNRYPQRQACGASEFLPAIHRSPTSGSVDLIENRELEIDFQLTSTSLQWVWCVQWDHSPPTI